MLFARSLPQVLSRSGVRVKLLTAGIVVASVFTVLIVALLVGGSLTQPPTAAAVGSASKAFAVAPEGAKLPGIQLPTL